MPFRGLIACFLVLVIAIKTLAQEPPPCASGQQFSPPVSTLPPLLTPPTSPPAATNPAQAPISPTPARPLPDYDHNYLYLPDAVPLTDSDACRPLGRWWVSPDLELAWLPTPAAPGSVRLRVPTASGESIPGPILPLGGVSPERFQGGFGLHAGSWLDEHNTDGLEASLFVLGGSDRTIEGYAPGMLLIFPDGHDRSAPQVLVLPSGTAITGFFPATLSTWFIGADANYRQNVYCSPNLRLDALIGYRFAYLQDELYLGESQDGHGDDYRRNRVSISNQFHGGQLGVAGEFRSNAWYVDGGLKVALGAMTSNVSASGLFAGAEGENASGSYSPLTSLADRSQGRFAVLPTLELSVGRQIRDHTRIFIGYSLQYLSHVVRMGDVLNAANGPNLTATDLWVSAMRFGLELRY
jgi:hypothetical protein